MSTTKIICGDALEVLASYGDGTFTAGFCDAPYGLGFMNKDWDHGVPGVPYWSELLRTSKPGAVLLAFGGTRTYHRLTCAIEDAGYEIGDSIANLYGPLLWVYGQGFPKSTDISKAIDKAALVECPACGGTGDGTLKASWEEWISKTRDHGGTREEWERLREPKPCTRCGGTGKVKGAERKVVGPNPWLGRDPNGKKPHTSVFTDDNWEGKPDTERGITAPATPDAATFAGYGTGLKPAWEPVVLARKPRGGTYAQCAIEHGAGALNIAAARIRPSGHDPRHGASACNPGSLHGILAYVDTGAVSLESFHDSLDRIVSALRYCSTGDKDLSRNMGDRDDTERDETQRNDQTVLSHLFPNGVWCGLNLSSTLDFRGGCPACHRFCDGQFRQLQVAAQVSAPSLADALEYMFLALSKHIDSHECQHSHPSNADALTLSSALLHLLWTYSIPSIAPLSSQGRWPANLILDPVSAAMVGEQSGVVAQSGFLTYNDGISEEQGERQCQNLETRNGELPGIKTSAMGDGIGNGASPAIGARSNSLSTDGCGSATTGLSPKAILSTTKTTTTQTTDLKTLSASRRQSITPTTSGSEKTTFGLTGKNNDAASDASSTSPLLSSPYGQQEHITDIAGPAQQSTKNSGKLGTHTMPETGRVNIGASPSRFFYCAKSARGERDAGLEGFALGPPPGSKRSNPAPGRKAALGAPRHNPHPCVKPLDLCRYLAALIRPPESYLDDAVLCVPFCGTGSEVIGAILAGWRNIVGIELDADTCDIARARVAWWQNAYNETGLSDPKALLKAMKKRKPLPLFERGK